MKMRATKALAMLLALCLPMIGLAEEAVEIIPETEACVELPADDLDPSDVPVLNDAAEIVPEEEDLVIEEELLPESDAALGNAADYESWAYSGDINRFPKKLSLGVKETFVLDGTEVLSGSGKITYTSSNKKVATVDKKTGKVKAKKTGTVKITAKQGKKKATCKITVKKAPKSVSVAPLFLELVVGEFIDLNASLPKKTASQLTYITSDSRVVDINEYGEVFAIAPGTATVTVQTFNKKEVSCGFTVVDDGETESPEDKDTFAFSYDEETDSYIVSGYDGDQSDIVIPSKYNGKQVSGIGPRAFAGNKKLTSIVVPGTVLNLQANCFKDCTNLAKLTLAEGLEHIGEGAFSGCTKLEKVIIPESVTVIEDKAFDGSAGLSICVYEGSYAQQWCADNTVVCKLVDGATEGAVTGLTVDQNYCAIGTDNALLFTVQSESDKAPTLYCELDGQSLGRMYDNGTNGDKKANDGIYSLRVTLRYDVPQIVSFNARSGAIRTDSVHVTFHIDLSSTGTEQAIGDICEQMQGIEADFLNASGFVPESKVQSAMNAVKKHAQALVDQGVLLDYYFTSDAVFMQTVYGLKVVYMPKVDGVDSNNTTPMGIRVLQPTRNTYINTDPRLVDGARESADMLLNAFDNFTLLHRYFDSQVTLDTIFAFGPNNIILWHGHGGYDPFNGPFLCTGEPYPSMLHLFGDAHFYKGEISITSNGNVLIYGNFIDNYCHSMDNSLVYLAACYSGKGSKLAKSFLNKGARAVVGNTDSIKTEYDVIMMMQIIENMTLDPLMTLEQSLKDARGVWGANDHVYCEKYNRTDSNPTYAYPKIFGDGDFQFKDPVLSGKVLLSTGETENEPLSDVEVSCYYNGKLLASTTTNALGKYELYWNDAVTGEITIVTSTGMYGEQTVTKSVVADEIYVQDIILQSTFGQVTGYVTDAATQRGIDGATLTLTDAKGNAVSPRGGFATTDADGLYAMTVGIGSYTLTASKSGYEKASAEIRVEPGATLSQHFALEAMASLSGKVIDKNTKEPLSDVYIAMQKNGNIYSVYTRADGTFTVENLSVDGQYTLSTKASGYKDSQLSVTVRLGQATELTQVIELETNGDEEEDPQGQDGALTGRVVDKVTGNPISNASVRLSGGTQTYTAVTGSDGVFSFTSIPGENDYIVTATKDGYMDSAVAATVRSGETTVLPSDIELGPDDGQSVESALSGRVVDKDSGAPLPSATIRLEGAGKVLTTTTGDDGTFSFDAIEADNIYYLTANKSGYWFDDATIKITDGTATKLSKDLMLEQVKSGSGSLEYTYDSTADEYGVSGYSGSLYDLVIPSVYDGKPVTRICSGAFSDCETLVSCTIPNTVKVIESDAFRNSSLRTVRIPGSVEIIGERSFALSDLREVVIEDGVQCIELKAFYDCRQLHSVVIGDSVRKIVGNAFRRCYKLMSVKLPKDLIKIGPQVFYDCRYLLSIDIPENVTYIGKQAFYDCGSLSTVTIRSKEIPDFWTDSFSGTDVRNAYVYEGSDADTYFSKKSKVTVHYL